MSKEQDRLLTDEEDGISPYVSEDFQEAYEESILKPICKAQRDLTRAETLKEVGEAIKREHGIAFSREHPEDTQYTVSREFVEALQRGEPPKE